MRPSLDQRYRVVSVVLGALTLLLVLALLACDAFPRGIAPGVHRFLGALALALIALAYLVYQGLRRVSSGELFKSSLLAVAFLLWAATQFWPNAPSATLFNDVAIGLFVLDIFLVIIEWPTGFRVDSLSESIRGPQTDSVTGDSKI